MGQFTPKCFVSPERSSWVLAVSSRKYVEVEKALAGVQCLCAKLCRIGNRYQICTMPPVTLVQSSCHCCRRHFRTTPKLPFTWQSFLHPDHFSKITSKFLFCHCYWIFCLIDYDDFYLKNFYFSKNSFYDTKNIILANILQKEFFYRLVSFFGFPFCA